MARLNISLLGSFHVTLDGQVITGFGTDKVRALLAYLATNTSSSHRREKLAGLLWPDQADQGARHNLSQTLSMLRQSIGDADANPPFLLVSRPTIQFNPDCDFWLDVDEFQTTLGFLSRSSTGDAAPPLAAVEQALSSYRGEFMVDVLLTTSLAFEEWQLYQRAHLHWLAVKGLGYVADAHEASGNYSEALRYARRQIELDPLREEAHRKVMRVLALSGQRSAAIGQFETCRRLLSEEMGIKPSVSTMRLYEQIRAGAVAPRKRNRLATAASPAGPQRANPAPTRNAHFVDRDQELAILDDHLRLALAGKSRMVFIAGQAGSGKTALLAEFCGRALERQPSLLAGASRCGTLSGPGSPYFPFRDILQTLGRGLPAEKAEAATARTRPGARTNQAAGDRTPSFAMDERKDSPDGWGANQAIGGWAPGGDGEDFRDDDYPAASAAALGRSRADSTGAGLLPAGDFFLELARFLSSLARKRPLLLILDDLQWADPGTINLLFHLNRNLGNSRILIIGSFRSDTLRPDYPGDKASLRTLLEKTVSRNPDSLINLDQADGRRLLDAVLDQEPNDLGPAFRARLLQLTGGLPLFVLEMLRHLKEREWLVQDGQKRWIEAPGCDWSALSPQLQTAIAERLGNLTPEQRSALTVASIQGMEFAAEVIAQVLGMGETDTIQMLSDQLYNQYQLVEPTGIRRVGAHGQRFSCYRFRQELVRNHLYQHLDGVKRPYLHETVALCLEGLYGGQAGEIASQLTWHFEQAGLVARSLEYLIQSGQRALALADYGQAAALLDHGMALLQCLPEAQERIRYEMKLLMSLEIPLHTVEGVEAVQPDQTHDRVRQLNQLLKNKAALMSASNPPASPTLYFNSRQT